MPDLQCPFCDSNVMMSDDKKQWCPKCGKGTMLEPHLQPDQRICSNPEPKAPRGKTSWKDGRLEFICLKCKHTKRKLRYVQPIGEAGRVRHDTTDGGCGPKCFKGEHLHVICCDCGYRQWDYCADHVEVPAPPIACKACGATKPLYSVARRLCHECHMNQFPNDTTQLPCKHSNTVSRQGTIIDDKIWSYIKTCADCGYEWEVLPENLPVRESGDGDGE
ncbi:hypothetical protein LCGC14_0817220 [marine sediment metagenome]|uniref:Uncharacterized protein n=1 Tax=marine sediment metagenome TaxID=412755 RepID=A0A0F9S4V1_9ZZZZ